MNERKVPEVRFRGFSGEWEKKGLKELAAFSKGHGFSKSDLVNDGFPIILYGSLYTKYETIILEVDTFIADNSNAIISNGDEVIVPASGETAEDISRASVVGRKGIVLGGDLNIIYPDKDIIPAFLAISISNGVQQREMMKRAQGKSVVHLHNSDLCEVKLTYPTQLEQTKIGEFFKNLDDLIAQNQKKYDKLVHMKKACLNKLFPKDSADTPEVRFKGFSGEWERKELGEMGKTYTGLSGKTKNDFGHGIGKYVTYMNVFSNPVAKPCVIEAIEIDEKQNEIKKGDVFFTTSSETPEEVGMSSVWLEDTKNIYLNSFCFGYRPEKTFDYFFLAYMLRSPSVRKKIIFLAQGISRYNVSKNRIMNISVPIIDTKEQTKIGTFFQTLDNLITLRKTELDKLKNIKKACLDKMFI